MNIFFLDKKKLELKFHMKAMLVLQKQRNYTSSLLCILLLLLLLKWRENCTLQFVYVLRVNGMDDGKIYILFRWGCSSFVGVAVVVVVFKFASTFFCIRCQENLFLATIQLANLIWWYLSMCGLEHLWTISFLLLISFFLSMDWLLWR